MSDDRDSRVKNAMRHWRYLSHVEQEARKEMDRLAAVRESHGKGCPIVFEELQKAGKVWGKEYMKLSKYCHTWGLPCPDYSY